MSIFRKIYYCKDCLSLAKYYGLSAREASSRCGKMPLPYHMDMNYELNIIDNTSRQWKMEIQRESDNEMKQVLASNERVLYKYGTVRAQLLVADVETLIAAAASLLFHVRCSPYSIFCPPAHNLSSV